MSSAQFSPHGDVAAIILENDRLRVAISPERGAKIASIVYKPLGKELLWQPPDGRYPPAAYAEAYDACHSTGFDEMFPTIVACRYESPPWMGTEVPDHGEVWSLPWNAEIEDETVRLEVYGIRFPYRLCKRIHITDHAMHIAYEAANLSPFDFDFIWAAHPLFNASPGMEIRIPPDMNAIINSVPGPRLQEYGKTYAFPQAETEMGPSDLSRIPPKNTWGFQKYYFSGPVTEGWCVLYDPNTKLAVCLTFPPKQVPYLGMWVNEGGWNGHYNVAPQPATGTMDRIDTANACGMNSRLRAKECKTWFLTISVSTS
jgi:galactose mutarotase-like enzyme